MPRSGDGGSSTRPFAKNLDRTSSHPHTSWPSPSRATSPQPTEPAQVGRVYPNHPAALRPGMRMGSNSPEQLNLHTSRDQVERMQVRLAARAERPGGFGTCVPGTQKRPDTRRHSATTTTASVTSDLLQRLRSSLVPNPSGPRDPGIRLILPHVKPSHRTTRLRVHHGNIKGT